MKIEVDQKEWDLFQEWKSSRTTIPSKKAVESLSEEEFFHRVHTIISDKPSSKNLGEFVETFFPLLIEHIPFSPKIRFSCEYVDCTGEWGHIPTGWDEKHSCLVFQVGGGTEIPLSGFLLSLQGEGLKIYFPEKGNCWNLSSLSPFGMWSEKAEVEDPKSLYSMEEMWRELEETFSFPGKILEESSSNTKD